MKTLIPVAFAIATLTAVPALAADCGDTPKAPVVPNAKHASKSEMLSTNSAMKSYIQDAEAYISCIGKGRRSERMQLKMENTALKYNLAVRRFKKRTDQA